MATGTNSSDIITPFSVSPGVTGWYFGLAGYDTIYGYDGDDTIDGGNGNDTLFGGNGDDKLFGGAGDDWIDGGFGFDTIDGGLGNDTTSYAFYWGPINANLSTGVVGFPGNSLLTDTLVSIENLIGTAGNDTIIGNIADNSLFGQAGNDNLNGGDGNDKLFGGAGDDWIDGGFGFDTIDGGLGNDTTSYAFYWGPINANLSTGVVGFPGNSALIDTLVSIENLIGTAGNDTIIGNIANNSLNGGAGNDSINGGDGVDTLIGGAGNDTLNGGFGADKFRFNSPSEKVDTIQDFFRTQGDKIEVSASGFGATSLSQISYNAGTGALSFLGTQFATIANLPAGFAVSSDVVLI
jgi:Ca2+-binding RTX toxin-like protein